MRGDELRRIGGGDLVDHRQAGFHRRAVPGIKRTVDRGTEQHCAAVLETGESVAPFEIVGRKARAGDRDQPAAGSEASEGGGEVTPRGVGDDAVDMDAGRERRVHQDDSRTDRVVEIVVDMGRVVPRNRRLDEERLQKRAADWSVLVEGQARVRKLGPDSEQAGPARWFQDGVVGHDSCGAGRDKAKRHRRGKLLEVLAFLRAPCVARDQARDLRQHCQCGLWRVRACGNRRAELAQEQDLRDLGRLIGVLPGPETLGVRAAEGLRQGDAEIGRANRLAAFEKRQKVMASMKNLGRTIGAISVRKRGGGRLGGAGCDHVHWNSCLQNEKSPARWPGTERKDGRIACGGPRSGSTFQELSSLPLEF